MEDRVLVRIARIDEIIEHNNADKLEIVRIEGWKCVVNKGEFKAGDLCVYFEIDSILPEEERYEFLRPRCWNKRYKGFRLKTIRLRGELSQGLALPLSLFPDKFDSTTFAVSMDVTELLGVVKYEIPIAENMRGLIKGGFPCFLVKTNEERIQNIPTKITGWQGKHFCRTEKLAGTSFTCYKYGGKFGVCSRNRELKRNEDNLYWQVAIKYNLEEKLQDGYCLQGEIFKVDDLKTPTTEGYDLFVFTVRNIETHERMNWNSMQTLCTIVGLKTVPMLERYLMQDTVQELIDMADGMSVINEGKRREGLVFRSEDNPNESFKILSNDYLLNGD